MSKTIRFREQRDRTGVTIVLSLQTIEITYSNFHLPFLCTRGNPPYHADFPSFTASHPSATGQARCLASRFPAPRASSAPSRAHAASGRHGQSRGAASRARAREPLGHQGAPRPRSPPRRGSKPAARYSRARATLQTAPMEPKRAARNLCNCQPPRFVSGRGRSTGVTARNPRQWERYRRVALPINSSPENRPAAQHFETNVIPAPQFPRNPNAQPTAPRRICLRGTKPHARAWS